MRERSNRRVFEAQVARECAHVRIVLPVPWRACDWCTAFSHKEGLPGSSPGRATKYADVAEWIGARLWIVFTVVQFYPSVPVSIGVAQW